MSTAEAAGKIRVVRDCVTWRGYLYATFAYGVCLFGAFAYMLEIHTPTGVVSRAEFRMLDGKIDQLSVDIRDLRKEVARLR